MKKTFILVLCLSMFIGQRSVLAKPMEIEEKLFQETLQQSKNVTGLLTDEYGNPIIGATILVKGTTQGVISDINGRFSIRVAVGETLSFSFIGYENVEKKVTSETEVFNIRMIEESTSLKDVVIVGFGKQKKASVVGAISSVKPESFKLPTSSLSASLAGRMSGVIAVQRSGEPGGDGADFWIRGIGTNGANSAPLILLDGVEISSGDLNDIQPDDIQSFSILKDASATALYGVRGANGVIVIETKQPEAGKLRLSYRGSVNIEVPDLSDYDVLNAAEKLQLEESAGLYKNEWADMEMALRKRQARIKQEVERGVDTYWLSKPLRTGVGHKHNLRLEGGGNDGFRYSASVQYNDILGVMKGSDRKTFNGNINLMYQQEKLLFRNNLEVGLSESNESPYGSFDQYVKLNPYWRNAEKTVKC